MDYKELLEKFAEIIEGLDENKIMEIHNEMCDDYNYPDDRIEYNDTDEIFNAKTPTEILLSVGENYDPSDVYAKMDGYGNWDSSDYVYNFVDFEELAEYVYDKEKFFDVDKLEELYGEFWQ